MKKTIYPILFLGLALVTTTISAQRYGRQSKKHPAFIHTVTPAQKAQNFTKFTVASWNIGHFALGKHGDTQLTLAQALQKQLEYRAFLNSINADILAILEYSPNLSNATTKDSAIVARNAVFGNYSNAQIGEKYDYNCNCLFSNGFKVIDSKQIMYSKMVQKRYYLVTRMLMGSDTVSVVATHVDWNQGENGATYRKLQIEELIEHFQKERFVILCADWNAKASEFDAFARAGYSMTNHGYLGDINTYPAGDSPTSTFDNIIVKGFSINNIQIQNQPQLTDHCMIQASLTKLPL